MATLIRSWTVGPGRACKHLGLPLPGHRDMAEVLASEGPQRPYVIQPLANDPPTKGDDHGPRPPKL